MPAKLKIKEEPAIVADFVSADDSKAAARLPAVGSTALVKATALNDDSTDWRGTCAVCLDLMPVDATLHSFYPCCCKKICSDCSDKWRQHDSRCPRCLAPGLSTAAEVLHLLQAHSGKGHPEAQHQLGDSHRYGRLGLEKDLKVAFRFFELAAAQGHAEAQVQMGRCHTYGEGVEIDLESAARWVRRAADQGYPPAYSTLGSLFYQGQGVAQSYDEAVMWFRRAAAQGNLDAIYGLGTCHAHGEGVPQDFDEAMRCFKRAAAQGHNIAAEAVRGFEAMEAMPG